ncbi:MAG: SGNH/GDSL hydrolase family protein [Gluconacetobacter diazotrophicus]|nr:SGNH/GDSL hydrolase family protein [Gluconacetobacter diazotrophicus]
MSHAPSTVLCYGDSNTHGTKPLLRPGVLERFGEKERWPGLLRSRLGADWRVIEEGLPARTTVHDDPVEGRHKNGLRHLRPCLESQLPVDWLVIMLGTNDLKARFGLSPADIAAGLDVLLREATACAAGPDGGQPALLVMAPVPIAEVGFLGEIFAGGAAKSAELAPRYAAVAARHGARFLDAGTAAAASPVDGVHYEADAHARLAAAVADAIAA